MPRATFEGYFFSIKIVTHHCSSGNLAFDHVVYTIYDILVSEDQVVVTIDQVISSSYPVCIPSYSISVPIYFIQRSMDIVSFPSDLVP